MKNQKSNQSPEAPQLLQEIQSWFSGLRRAPDAEAQAKWMDEASRFLTASNTLSARERLEIYVNDYWPRCLESLAEDFPLLRRLLGARVFSEWMVRYLESFPSRSYSLYHLPEQMPAFFEANFRGKNRSMVLELIDLEWAIAQSRFVEQRPVFSVEKLSDSERMNLPSREFTFQKHVFLQACSFDFIAWENTTKKWPKCQSIYVLIFRNETEIKTEKIPHGQWLIFSGLNQGLSLENAIEQATEYLPDFEVERLGDQIQNWFTDGIRAGVWVS